MKRPPISKANLIELAGLLDRASELRKHIGAAIHELAVAIGEIDATIAAYRQLDLPLAVPASMRAKPAPRKRTRKKTT